MLTAFISSRSVTAGILQSDFNAGGLDRGAMGKESRPRSRCRFDPGAPAAAPPADDRQTEKSEASAIDADAYANDGMPPAVTPQQPASPGRRTLRPARHPPK